MNELTDRLAKEFGDGEYAHAYMESHLVSRLAAQIHALRRQRGWSQEQLAEKSGIAQERISKIESADFESLTLKTLQKFSRAFDVNLQVEFVAFSSGIRDVVSLSKEALKVEPRAVDLANLQSQRTYFPEQLRYWQSVFPALPAPTISIVPGDNVYVVERFTTSELAQVCEDWPRTKINLQDAASSGGYAPLRRVQG